MAKRGRKPLNKRKGYFYEQEEKAILEYLNCTDESEKNRIYNTYLMPAFDKMIPSIIRKWKFYIPDEEYEQTYQDTLSYLVTKMGNFKPVILQYEKLDNSKVTDEITYQAVRIKYDEFHKIRNNVQKSSPQYYFVDDDNDLDKIGYYAKIEKHYKAYSYCGTVAKNYLIQKSKKYTKQLERTLPYDCIMEEVNNGFVYTIDETNNIETATRLIREISKEIKTMTQNPEENELTPLEVKVGEVLYDLLDNWEEVLSTDISGSLKLNKSAILYYLREQLRMSTKEFRDNMKKYKSAYKLLKKMVL